MKKWFLVYSVLFFLGFLTGCEDEPTYDPGVYVTVYVRNDSMYQIGVMIGNGEANRIAPGRETSISRKLLEDENMAISIVFYDYYGYVFSQSATYWFDDDQYEYHMNVIDTYQIRIY